MKIESLILEQAITPETFDSGAFVCITAYNGTIYSPPKNAIMNKQKVIMKFPGFPKNSKAPIIAESGLTGGLSLTYHNNTLEIAIPYAEAGTYFVVTSPFNK